MRKSIWLRLIHWVARQLPRRPGKVRRKRDPGRCFLRAGWRRVGVVRGLVVLRAPDLEAARV